MSDAPAVSLIVGCYNHERYVEQSLDSVAAQTFGDVEVVISDDCSTDDSVAVIERWLQRTGYPATLLVNERNLGVCATRNRALDRCRGTFVSVVSGDDWYHPEKLERQVGALHALDDSVCSVFSDMQLVDAAGRPTGTWWRDQYHADGPPAEGRIFEQLVRGNFLPAPTVMTRRAALASVGPYDESLPFEDYDMWLRLSSRYEFRFVPGRLVNYRVLGTSMSHDPAWAVTMREGASTVLRKWRGVDPATDRLVANALWSQALQAFALDADRGRALLHAPDVDRSSPRRRAISALTRLPGGRAAVRAGLRARQRRDTR